MRGIVRRPGIHLGRSGPCGECLYRSGRVMPPCGMRISLAGRVTLVSGGSRGIGRAICLALAEAGANVAVNCRRDAAAAEDTVAAVQKRGRRAKAYAAAVEDYAKDERMVAEVVLDFGSLDILVNNAGIPSRGESVADTEPAEEKRVLHVHAFGSHYLSKLEIPHLR